MKPKSFRRAFATASAELNENPERWFNRLAIVFLAARLLVLVARLPLPPTHPHIWRQVDTLSVAIRYWNRWVYEPSANESSLVLPAVLQSQGTSGIVASEFPLLNLLTAPSFALGPYYGRILASGIVVAIAFGLVLFVDRLSRGQESRERGTRPFLWLPVFSFGAVYASRFMPDFTSVLLVLAAILLARRSGRAIAPSLLATAGLLMKPTSIAVVPLAFAFREPARSVIGRTARWLAPALALALAYYSIGISYLTQHQLIETVFGVTPRSFPQTLVEWFSDPPALFSLLFKELFFPGGLAIIAGTYAFRSFCERRLVFSGLWSILAVQVLMIAALDGAHSYAHDYYFLATTPTACAIFARWWVDCRSQLLKAAMVAIVTARLWELSYGELQYAWRSPPPGTSFPARQCAQLIARNPEVPWKQGVEFRSSWGPYPALAVCFGERSRRDVARFGYFWRTDQMPSECQQIDRSDDVILTECRATSAPVDQG